MKTATWFALWALVGAAGALALLTAPTIGIFVLPGTLGKRVGSGWCRPRLGPARRR